LLGKEFLLPYFALKNSFQLQVGRSCSGGKEYATSFSRDVAGKRVPLTVLCVEKMVFSCRSGDHAAVERNTQRPFQETLLGK
jgi:hypothetical protein